MALRTEEPPEEDQRRSDGRRRAKEDRPGVKGPKKKRENPELKTYISVYDVEGKVLMPETVLPFEDTKFEGAEPPLRAPH